MVLGVGIPAADFYIRQRNYADPASFVYLFLAWLALVTVRPVWAVFCLALVSTRWRRFGWFGLAPLAVIVALIVYLDGTKLWLDYNFASNHETRLAFARQHQTADPACATPPATARPLNFPDAFGQPETYATGNGTYVYYRTLEGGGFLYAPKPRGNPISDLPSLYVDFANVWDREACVYLIGIR